MPIMMPSGSIVSHFYYKAFLRFPTYGVLYAITPELFLTKDRGTGNAITAMANRIFGIMVRFFYLF